jgi:hypothetical protein
MRKLSLDFKNNTIDYSVNVYFIFPKDFCSLNFCPHINTIPICFHLLNGPKIGGNFFETLQGLKNI